jgi:arylformamidase
MGVHSGTHIDGSLHFYDDGSGVDALPLDAMLGRCLVAEVSDPGEAIDRATLEALAIPAGTERVILKTPNSQLWDRAEFTHDFVRLDGDGAGFVLERGIRLIGIDYLSIGDHDAHLALLGNGVVALEGVDLRAIDPGEYELICLPMKLTDTDGAPARVLLRDLDEEGDR